MQKYAEGKGAFCLFSAQCCKANLGSVSQALRPGSETLLDAVSLEAIAGDAPSTTLPHGEVVDVLLADVMVAAGLQPSKGAVRR